MNRLKPIVNSILIIVLVAVLIPYVIPLTGDVSFTPDYRVPYNLGEDYFLYRKYSEHVNNGRAIPFIGDSVIWGHYTESGKTLTACLNKSAGSIRFANMGLDGIHPAAMNGLVRLYSADHGNKKIIVGINLLWMSSSRHDLSGAVNSEINHRILLPQFYPRIPAYRPAFEEKISAVITRSVPFFSWISHLRLTRLAGKSLYLWTMDNPHSSIRDYLRPEASGFNIPEGTDPSNMRQQNIDWVTPDKSLQWKFMLDTLLLLKNNGNRVAAVITPFNTYMMTEESREKYFLILAEMEWILRENGIVPLLTLIPEKKYFADSSHPNAEGYKLIADDLMKNSEFIDFINQ